ncbi:MAG: hypothetical protein HFG90_05490 [Acholeplasmatales bacterium]|jgi:cytochrome bd-type quinol oxidase subunit 2|nr:hypothetical protein [Acholeplasmatales bacterium]
MGINNIRKEEQTSQKNTPLMSIFRVIILIAFVVVMSCTILYFVEMNSDNKSYFTIHFALPLILFMVGIIALFMAMLSKQSLTGESKGDNLMIVVGILLMVCSVIALVWSYFN